VIGDMSGMGLTQLEYAAKIKRMQKTKIVYWRDEDAWIGYLQDYPDYWTQGKTLDDLKDHLKDLYLEMTNGKIPGIRKVEELVVS
jgi:predicted RNase H-like HicB family nuclease